MSGTRVRHRTTSRALAVLAGVLLVLGSTSYSTAQSQSSPAKRAAAAAAERDTAAAQRRDDGGKFGIPPLPYDPTGSTSAYGSEFGIQAVARKAKVALRLDKVSVFTHFRFCIVSVLGNGQPPFESCCPDPTNKATCFHANPPATTYDDSGNVFWIDTSGPSWVASPRNVTPTFGSFAPQRVKLLAFGSIPATATVTIKQHRPPGRYVSPLDLQIDLEGTALPAGTLVPSYSRTVAAPQADATFFSTKAFVRGDVDVRISDVAIDKVPLDVGSNCSTARPAKLDLTSPAGFYDGNADVRSLRGRPGQLQTVTGSYVTGTVSIPRFSGCGAHGEDLDPLITGLVSGTGNPVDAEITVGLNNCATTAGSGYPCPPRPPDTPAPAAVAARGAQAPGLTTLLADRSQLKGLARSLARSTPAVRSTALDSLPAPLARAVRAELR